MFEKLEINRGERREEREAANEVPGPDERCEESTDAAWPAVIPPVGHKEHTRDSTSSTAPAALAGSRGQLRGAVPRAAEQPALGPGPPAALGQCLHSHTAQGWKDTLAQWKPHRAAVSRWGALPDLFLSPCSMKHT